MIASECHTFKSNEFLHFSLVASDEFGQMGQLCICQKAMRISTRTSASSFNCRIHPKTKRNIQVNGPNPLKSFGCEFVKYFIFFAFLQTFASPASFDICSFEKVAKALLYLSYMYSCDTNGWRKKRVANRIGRAGNVERGEHVKYFELLAKRGRQMGMRLMKATTTIGGGNFEANNDFFLG